MLALVSDALAPEGTRKAPQTAQRMESPFELSLHLGRGNRRLWFESPRRLGNSMSEEYLQRIAYSPSIPLSSRQSFVKRNSIGQNTGRVIPRVAGFHLVHCFFMASGLKAITRRARFALKSKSRNTANPILDRSHHIPGVRICLKHRLPSSTWEIKAARQPAYNPASKRGENGRHFSPLRAHGLLDHLQTAVAKLLIDQLIFTKN